MSNKNELRRIKRKLFPTETRLKDKQRRQKQSYKNYQSSYHKTWVDNNRSSWNKYQCEWRKNNIYSILKSIHSKIKDQLNISLPLDIYSKRINNHPLFVSVILSHSNPNIQIFSKLTQRSLAKQPNIKKFLFPKKISNRKTHHGTSL